MGPLFFPLALCTVRRIKASSVPFGQVSSTCRMVYLKGTFHIFPCCNRHHRQVSSLLKEKQNLENVLSIPFLDQDRGQSLGTLPTPPSLTSQEVSEHQVFSFTGPQQPEGPSGSLRSSTPPAWISSSAPSPVHSELSSKDGDPTIHWGHWSLLKLFDHPPRPLLSNHLELR